MPALISYLPKYPRISLRRNGDRDRSSEEHMHAIAWLDDASRCVLAGGEFESANGEHSIATFRAAQANVEEYKLPIREANTDRGSQFFGNKGDGATKCYLEAQGIVHVPSRVKNPQTNGKLERFWYEYDRHRWSFGSFEDFAS